jgi:hypothetical protein
MKTMDIVDQGEWWTIVNAMGHEWVRFRKDAPTALLIIGTWRNLLTQDERWADNYLAGVVQGIMVSIPFQIVPPLLSIDTPDDGDQPPHPGGYNNPGVKRQ